MISSCDSIVTSLCRIDAMVHRVMLYVKHNFAECRRCCGKVRPARSQRSLSRTFYEVRLPGLDACDTLICYDHVEGPFCGFLVGEGALQP